MKPAHPERPARPLVIVGWDGATPELVEPWMADGTLPHLAALAKRGAWAPLRSLIHPLSPAAWTSAMTGLNPGRHGVWDFGHRAPGTYRVDPTTNQQRHGATVWEIAEQCGLRWASINVPLAAPAPPTERGHFVPGLGADVLEGHTWPRELAGQIEAELPGYRLDSNAYEHADPAGFLADVHAMVGQRAHLATSLLHRERPDVMVCVFVATDRVQHAFWKQSALPGVHGRGHWRFADAIRDAYRAQDEALGRLVEAAGPDATVLVVSDHGFGELDGDLFLNGILEDEGWLAVRRPPSRVDRLPAALRPWARRVRAELPPRFRRPEADLTFGDIDWQHTVAYSRGLFGNVWLNLRGREPHGVVEPGPPADALLERITDRLLAQRGPDGRTPLFDAVLRGAELYWGEQAEHAPDLVAVPREYRWMTRSGREIGPRGQVVGEPAVRHTGNHRIDGVFVGAGPGIAQGARPSRLRLMDLTPTALALLGIEVPRGLDGVPMSEVLSCDVGWTDELPQRAPDADPPPERGPLEERLQALGYLAP